MSKKVYVATSVLGDSIVGIDASPTWDGAVRKITDGFADALMESGDYDDDQGVSDAIEKIRSGLVRGDYPFAEHVDTDTGYTFSVHELNY